jgi:uncharacterized protein YndB with AHSA1/START domain
VTQETAQDLLISRVFDAPRELVWRAFTDPDQLAQWFGPVGYSVPRDTVDIDRRPGGHERFVMVNDADPAERHPMDSIYSEVIENEVLAGYQDAEGLPGADGAVRMEFRLEFHDEPDGRTRLDLRAAASSAKEQDEMREGWESSFTKLDQLLQD